MAIPLGTPCAILEESTHENDTLRISIQGRLESLPDDDPMITIFRVPSHIREANKQLYEPRMVSIGPYYSGREELRAMEQLKLRYLRDILGRGTGEQIPPLCSYVRAVREVEDRARRSYYEQTKLFGIKSNEASLESVRCGSRDSAETSEQAQSDGFAEMLLLDGCFVLEFLLKWLENNADSVGWGVDLLNSDLLLLENQIPFFVLVSLYTVLGIERDVIPTPSTELSIERDVIPTPSTVLSIERDVIPTPSTVLGIERDVIPTPSAVLSIERDVIPTPSTVLSIESNEIPTPSTVLSIESNEIPTPKDQLVFDLINLLQNDAFSQGKVVVPGTVFTVEIHHLLHLYHEAFVPKLEPHGSAEAQAQSSSRLVTSVIPCATQLREAGVKFDSKKKPKHMFDLTFSNGVMEIPTLEIDHARTPLLVNLIAFEQSMGKKGAAAPLMSYTALITSLVRTGKDIEVLQKADIINNMLSSEDDAAKSYFNHLGDSCTLDYETHYYASEFRELNKYYESKWNKYKAKFRRDYCANPCSIVSFLVAVLVFSFAISQVSINFYRLHGAR